MNKKKGHSRKDLIKRVQSYQNQYNNHQEKIKNNPISHSIEHWKKEKTNFVSRINYYISKGKLKKEPS